MIKIWASYQLVKDDVLFRYVNKNWVLPFYGQYCWGMLNDWYQQKRFYIIGTKYSTSKPNNGQKMGKRKVWQKKSYIRFVLENAIFSLR